MWYRLDEVIGQFHVCLNVKYKDEEGKEKKEEKGIPHIAEGIGEAIQLLLLLLYKNSETL